MLQDAHLHLQDITVPGVRDEIIARAADADIGRFFCNATSPADWDAVAQLADRSIAIVPFFGVHPWHVDDLADDWYDRLVALISARPAAGIGEIGLDGSKGKPPFEKQQAVFERQLDLAIERGRSVAVHCVHAWGPLLESIRERPIEQSALMVHAYAGSRETLAELVRRGVRISLSSRFLARAPEKARELLSTMPPGQLFVETDFPYLPADPAAGITAAGYLKALRDAYAVLASLAGTAPREVEERVWRNGADFLARGESSFS